MRVRLALFLCAPALALAQWHPASDDAESIYQDAGNTITDESGAKDVTPRLEFHCSPGDGAIIARIDWQRFISSFSTEVGFKVDDGRFTWLKWKLTSNEQVTYSPGADDTQKLIAALGSGDSLLVDVTPYSEGPVTVTFDLAGLHDALGELAARCQ